MSKESKDYNQDRRSDLERQIGNIKEELIKKQNLEKKLKQLEQELRELNANNDEGSNKNEEAEIRRERKRKLNDVYRYIQIKEDGNIEVDKEKLKDGKMTVGDTEYPELGEGKAGIGYKVEDNRIIIGTFDENGKTSGETIIVGKDGNLMIGMTENGEKKGSRIIQIKNMTIVDVDENGKERLVRNNNEILSNSQYGEFLTREKHLKDGDEMNISSHEDLKKYTKDKKILAIYDEKYFEKKTLSLKYFDNINKVHRIKKAEKVGEDKINVTYTEGLEKSSITGKTGNNVSDGLCLFMETNKSEKVNRVKEREGNDEEEKVREERKRKLNDVYRYIQIKEDGSIEVDKEKLKDGKMVIGETEYSEIEEGQTGLGYKIEDGGIMIGDFNEQGKTSGETIIVGKNGNLMIGMMENGKRKGEWIKQSTISIISINGNREDAQIDGEEKKETLKSSQYGKFDSILLGFNQEIEIKSKAQLKKYVKDQNVFNEMTQKYDDEYFKTRSLSVKGVASPSTERENCEIKKAEKVGNKVDVTYETNVYTGITPSIAGTCLFVEINKGDKVTRIKSKEERGEIEDWENDISEETVERIKLLREYTIFEGGLIGLDKERLQDNKLKIGEIEYSERTKGNEGNFYEIIESRPISKEGKEYTMGTKLIVGEYDKDGNPKGNMITIDSNGIITVGNILPESLPRSLPRSS